MKFPSFHDRKSIGREEYRYVKCAGKCKITVPEVKLFPSARGDGFFGARRFDRVKGEKIHMVTVSGLLETSASMETEEIPEWRIWRQWALPRECQKVVQ